MSVLVSNRSKSRLEMVYYPTVIKDEIVEFCIRSFGVKDIGHIVREKYERGIEKSENPNKYVLLLHQSKQNLIFLTDGLIEHTRSANRIRLTDKRRCDLRLDYLDRSLCDCEMIISKLQNIVDIFLIDVNKMERYVLMIDREIELIRDSISYTNKKKRGMV